MHSSSVLARHRVDGIGGGHGFSPSVLLSRHISDPRGVSASENRPWADIERIKLYLIIYSFVSLHSLWTLHATQHPDSGLQPTCVHPGGPGERAEARTPRGRRPIPLDLHASGHGTAPRPSLCQTPDRLLEPRALPPLATSGSHPNILICPGSVLSIRRRSTSIWCVTLFRFHKLVDRSVLELWNSKVMSIRKSMNCFYSKDYI